MNIKDKIQHFHDDEAGMMTFANAVMVLLMCLLFVFTINHGHVVNKKVAGTIAADAVTKSAGVVMARGMNAVTATNHLMGEMLSLVIIHEAIGGKKQENGTSADSGRNESLNAGNPRKLKEQDRLLKAAYYAAKAMKGVIKGPEKTIFDMVYQRDGQSKIYAEAMLLDAKMDLKDVLTKCYGGMVVAAALKMIPYTRPAGEALEIAMNLLELKVAQEYGTLKIIHSIADSLLPAKKLLRDYMLPTAKQYTMDVVRVTPQIARETARRIGELNNVTADVFPTPRGLELPVQIDPLSWNLTLPRQRDEAVPANKPNGCGCPSDRTPVSQDQVCKMTQLARAAFPWVNYHRKPILDALGTFFHLCDAQEYYFHWSNGYSKYVVREMQTNRSGANHLGLYVLKGYDGPDKGFERWNIAEYSYLADDYFTLIGLAHQASPTVIGKPIFQQQHSNGMLTWSMAMLYNGNGQQRPEQRIVPTCKRIVPIRQANCGMDTLNWYPGSRQDREGCGMAKGEPVRSVPGENRPFELLGIGLPAEYPRTQVNWQAKLVPATAYRLTQMSRSTDLPAPFRPIIDRVLSPYPRSLATH